MEPVHPTYTMPLSKAYVLYAELSTTGTKLQKTYHYKNVYNRPSLATRTKQKLISTIFIKYKAPFFN